MSLRRDHVKQAMNLFPEKWETTFKDTAIEIQQKRLSQQDGGLYGNQHLCHELDVSVLDF